MQFRALPELCVPKLFPVLGGVDREFDPEHRTIELSGDEFAGKRLPLEALILFTFSKEN